MKGIFFCMIACVLVVLPTPAQQSPPPTPSETPAAIEGESTSSQTLVLPPVAPGQVVTPQMTAPPPAGSGRPSSPQTLVLPPQGQPTLPVQSVPGTPSAPPVQGQIQSQAPPPPPVGRMYAMRASGAIPEKPYLDEKLKAVAPALKSLPFTSYESVSINDQVLPWGQETLFPINAVYALRVTPMSLEADGTITLRARVEMLQGETYVNALNTAAHAVQNQALLFRGMPLGQGELLIVLLVSMPPEEQKEGTASEESPPQSEGEGESTSEGESNEAKEGEQEPQKADTAEQQDTQPLEPEEGEQEKPEGVENLEALLESLDDIDRQEQVEERNRRDRIDFKGDWW